MADWSLDNPHPDHTPTVLPYITGRPGGGRRGTALRCSCTTAPPALVSNGPPSGRGRIDANEHYQVHVNLATDVAS